jgi:hypothetical protein
LQARRLTATRRRLRQAQHRAMYDPRAATQARVASHAPTT